MPAALKTFVSRPGPRGSDGLLALVFTVLVQLELWLGEEYEGLPAFPGDAAATAPFLVVMTGALAWRRSRPVAAVVVAMATIALQSVATGGSEAAGLFLLLLLLAYSGAAYGDRPVLLAAVTAAAIAVHDLFNPFLDNGWQTLFTFAFVGAGFALGRVMHGRGVHTRLLTERARRLEHEREQEARLAVAEERARIARELHDVVAHSVSVMVIQSLAAQSVLGDGNPAAREALRKIEATGRDAMTEMRRLVGMLREHDHHGLEPQPGLADLPALVATIERAGVSVDLRVEGERRALPPGVELTAYRVVQEGLTNVLKHAAAARAHVLVRHLDAAVEVAVIDDGPALGDGADLPAGGHGLVGMRERVALYGGELEAGPRPQGGFAVRARLPLTAQAAAAR